MTKFVPKEVIGDSTFVSVYDPESGDTGYVRMGGLVRRGCDPRICSGKGQRGYQASCRRAVIFCRGN